MESDFLKNSILHNKNEFVTSFQLQNYLDTLSSHVEKQLSQKIITMNQDLQVTLKEFRDDIEGLVKEKASRKRLMKDCNFILD